MLLVGPDCTLVDTKRRDLLRLVSTEPAAAQIVARKSRPACRRALARSYSCTWCLGPPSRNDAPNMNNELVTIAAAMEAFASVCCSARNAASGDARSALQRSQLGPRGLSPNRSPLLQTILAGWSGFSWMSTRGNSLHPWIGQGGAAWHDKRPLARSLNEDWVGDFWAGGGWAHGC